MRKCVHSTWCWPITSRTLQRAAACVIVDVDNFTKLRERP